MKKNIMFKGLQQLYKINLNFVFKPNKQYRFELPGPKHILNPDGSFSSI